MKIDTILKALEADVKAKNPTYDLGMVYASMYGMLSAYITLEQLETILRHKGIDLDTLTQTL